MGHVIRGGGRRMHMSALFATLVALAQTTTGPAHAAIPAAGEAAAGPAGTIAAVAPRHRLRLDAGPGGPTGGGRGDPTPVGSRTRLAVLGRRRGWLAVSSEALGNARRAWIK